MNALGNPILEPRQAGQNPDPELLDRVKASGPSVIRALIELAIDARLNQGDQDSAEVWAPLHAVVVLGELRAVEAVEPPLPLFSWDDDDWMSEALPEAFGRIGEPALPAMDALLRDTEKTVWTRLRAARALTKIAQEVPTLRDQVVAIFAARLNPSEQQPNDDEVFTGFVISELLNLRAIEALPAIDAAFDADRVDLMILGEDDVAQELELASPLPDAQRWPRDLLQGLALPGGTPPKTEPGRFAMPVRSVKVGRNVPCPCGSGKKFKKCCGPGASRSPPAARRMPSDTQEWSILSPGPCTRAHGGRPRGKEVDQDHTPAGEGPQVDRHARLQRLRR